MATDTDFVMTDDEVRIALREIRNLSVKLSNHYDIAKMRDSVAIVDDVWRAIYDLAEKSVGI